MSSIEVDTTEDSRTHLTSLRAAELGELLASRAVSPREVVEAYLARIAEADPVLCAYSFVAHDSARAVARSVEKEILRGDYRGVLHGLPVAYKDIIDVTGMPTAAGSRMLGGEFASRSATIATRLRRRGAICLGKLTMNEFSAGGQESPGPVRNPWNTAMTAGGSSAGAGAAVAAGLAPLAVGADTGGSIRIPAAFCGIVGLRPTYGRVSRDGIFPLSWSLDQAGPMAKTVEDTAVLFIGIAGVDTRDGTTRKVSLPDDLERLSCTNVDGITVGVPEKDVTDDLHPDVSKHLNAAVAIFEGAGAVARPVALPSAHLAAAAGWLITYAEALSLHYPRLASHSRGYTSEFLRKMLAAMCFDAEEYVLAQRIRRRIVAEFEAALTRCEILITATTSHPANALGAPYDGGDLGAFTRPVSLAGLPALALPAGLTTSQLPTSIQLIGRAWDEGTVLRVGSFLERSIRWEHRTLGQDFRSSDHPSSVGSSAQAVNRVAASGALQSRRNLRSGRLTRALRALDLEPDELGDDAGQGIVDEVSKIRDTLQVARSTLGAESAMDLVVPKPTRRSSRSRRDHSA